MSPPFRRGSVVVSPQSLSQGPSGWLSITVRINLPLIKSSLETRSLYRPRVVAHQPTPCLSFQRHRTLGSRCVGSVGNRTVSVRKAGVPPLPRSEGSGPERGFVFLMAVGRPRSGVGGADDTLGESEFLGSLDSPKTSTLTSKVLCPTPTLPSGILDLSLEGGGSVEVPERTLSRAPGTTDT